MTNTIDDWLDSDDEPTPEQRTFWEECLLHAKELEDFGIATVQLDSGASGGFLFLIFDVGDTLHNKALRDLRIEFDGDKVRCGEDKRNWLEGFDPQ